MEGNGVCGRLGASRRRDRWAIGVPRPRPPPQRGGAGPSAAGERRKEKDELMRAQLFLEQRHTTTLDKEEVVTDVGVSSCKLGECDSLTDADQPARGEEPVSLPSCVRAPPPLRTLPHLRGGGSHNVIIYAPFGKKWKNARGAAASTHSFLFSVSRTPLNPRDGAAGPRPPTQHVFPDRAPGAPPPSSWASAAPHPRESASGDVYDVCLTLE